MLKHESVGQSDRSLVARFSRPRRERRVPDTGSIIVARDQEVRQTAPLAPTSARLFAEKLPFRSKDPPTAFAASHAAGFLVRYR